MTPTELRRPPLVTTSAQAGPLCLFSAERSLGSRGPGLVMLIPSVETSPDVAPLLEPRELGPVN